MILLAVSLSTWRCRRFLSAVFASRNAKRRVSQRAAVPNIRRLPLCSPEPIARGISPAVC